jgi:hypothetical protein
LKNDGNTEYIGSFRVEKFFQIYFIQNVDLMAYTIKIFKSVTSKLKEAYRNHNTDAYIISFPNSGRTWLRVLIGKALCEKFGFSDEILVDTYKATSKAGILRTQFIHDYSSIIEGYSYRELPTDKSEYAGKKIIFLVRDIRDILVSHYFQATKRVGSFNGNISDFIRHDKYGAMKIITFYNIWYENMSKPRGFLLVRYEDIHKNPEKITASVLSFLGLDGIEDDIIRTSAEFASFRNLKNLEKEDYFQSDKIRPADTQDDESYKVRKGLIGGYRSYLSKADIEYIDELLLRLRCPFLKYT